MAVLRDKRSVRACCFWLLLAQAVKFLSFISQSSEYLEITVVRFSILVLSQFC